MPSNPNTYVKVIIPGHDPAVMTNFPQITARVVKIR
jgi:hypothetical protein